MFGKNPKLKPEYRQCNILKVNNIFVTFQGEGPYVGYPSIFIRLSGCNLACNFCDTEFDSYKEMKIEEIIAEGYTKLEDFKKTTEARKALVVITGGEPMRQNISMLCNELINRGHLVQVESNGTLISPDIPKEVKIVCSPKVTNGKYHKIRPEILARVIAVKFIVSAHNQDYSDIGDVGQESIPVYIQPMDEYDAAKNQRNLQLAMNLCFQHNHILCLQTHKFIGID
jgi:7-carboxy-7-deazaguanine synthase